MSKKKFTALQSEYDLSKEDAMKCEQDLARMANKLDACEQDKARLKTSLQYSEEQIDDLKKQREKQYDQVGDLTVLSKSAAENMKSTLNQLQSKDKYISMLQAARTKADSLNLALAVNLKGVLKEGINDSDIDIKVDKTVVMVNLSDKMLFKSGSYNLTTRANEVLEKIAQIVNSRPDLEVMVEGYTDNVPIKNNCIQDNWDLSVKRSTSVVRSLQDNFNIDPNRLIAAGRGEYNVLASNETAEGRSKNRRTRIIIMPKLEQFYDLLNPENAPADALK